MKSFFWFPNKNIVKIKAELQVQIEGQKKCPTLLLNIFFVLSTSFELFIHFQDCDNLKIFQRNENLEQPYKFGMKLKFFGDILRFYGVLRSNLRI